MASRERLFQRHARQRERSRHREPDQQWRHLSWCQPLGAHLCHLHCLVGTECQLYGRHHRCHAHLSAYGPHHRHGSRRGHQRSGTAQAVGKELSCRHGHQCAHGYCLFPADALERGAVGASRPHLTHALRRADRALRRCCRHPGALYEGQGKCHPRSSHRHSPHAASLHGRLRTGHGQRERFSSAPSICFSSTRCLSRWPPISACA